MTLGLRRRSTLSGLQRCDPARAGTGADGYQTRGGLELCAQAGDNGADPYQCAATVCIGKSDAMIDCGLALRNCAQPTRLLPLYTTPAITFIPVAKGMQPWPVQSIWHLCVEPG